MMNSLITLIGETYITDEIGNQKPSDTPIETTIFCNIESISQSEFFSAAQTGLRPDHKVVVYCFEYNNERLAELNGKRYVIYRTYQRKGDLLELYLTEKAGV